MEYKETMPLVSVIIPVYNAAAYVENCVQSVCRQTVENLQIILVDDCSLDYSAECCKGLAQKDSRIEFYQQEKNKGVSAARNKGLLFAAGTYILFVDADDLIDEDMIENLLGMMDEDQVDLAVCGYYIDNSPQLNKNCIRKEMTRLDAARETAGFNGSLMKGYSVNKLFKRERIFENQLWFDEETYICEDLLFCMQYIWHSRMIVYDPVPKYHYITHSASAMHGVVNARRMSVLETFQKIITVGKWYEDPILEELLQISYWNHYVSILKDVVRDFKGRKLKYGDRVYPYVKHIALPFLKSRFVTIKRKVLISGLLCLYPVWRILPDKKN